MDVLSREELDFFAEQGYVVARQVIDRDQAARTERAVWAFTGMDPDDSGDLVSRGSARHYGRDLPPPDYVGQPHGPSGASSL